MLACFIVFNRISNTLLILQVGLLVHWSLIIILVLIVFERCIVVLHGDTKGYQSINEDLGSCSLQTVYTTDNAFSNVDLKILHCRKKRVVFNIIFHCEVFHRWKNVEHNIGENVKPVVVSCKKIVEAQILLEFFLLSNHYLNTVNFGVWFVRANTSYTTNVIVGVGSLLLWIIIPAGFFLVPHLLYLLLCDIALVVLGPMLWVLLNQFGIRYVSKWRIKEQAAS